MPRLLRFKKFDYTQPEDFEDDDGDFSSASLPPSKMSQAVTNSDDENGDKAKPAKKALSGTKKSRQVTALNTAAGTARDGRPSLDDERLFERELKEVLALAGDQTEVAASSRESSQEAVGSATVNTDDPPDNETGESSESAGKSDSDDSDHKKPFWKFKVPRVTAATANRRGSKAAVARGSRTTGAARGAGADVGPDPAPRQSAKRLPPPAFNEAGVADRATASPLPKWVPPGPALHLGLSKRAKLTPLHPDST
ncbi:nuclear ubiquitous casein and cyclin-dependent kinase substrate 1-like isoform X1 [Lethenteron reissneri]|uniref:nuclear ubiquitous casein and cyclin-dependent kinase substrate 1-like isoform X1 n=2 Tax=Lethenteron reissneri TaxID=7753 RepID=UPI002AB6EB40|nr:nuclear ubiquitous casein and cyclin-dependent kinase substrate 1-like isoform X1 [Lethenteron reissneri]